MKSKLEQLKEFEKVKLTATLDGEDLEVMLTKVEDSYIILCCDGCVWEVEDSSIDVDDLIKDWRLKEC